MRRDIIAALRLTLRGDLSLRKSRLESFCVLVVGVLLSRTVNLSHLACLFPTQAAIASNYRRLQRFFAQVILVLQLSLRVGFALMALPVTVLGHGLMDAPPQRPAEEMI